jgi:predicted GNAT family acetyltransferase
MGETVRYVGRELRAADWEAIARVVAAGPRHETLLLEPLLAATRAGDPEVWWYGALADARELRALMGVRGHSAVVHGQSEASIDGLAREALKAQQLATPGAPRRHQLFGEERTIERFWAVFKGVGRQVVVDRPRPLLAAPSAVEPPSGRATVRLATAADAKLVFELTGDQVVEAQAWDPRRANRAAHEARVAQTIGQGRQLVAEANGKPVLVAELVLFDDTTAILERVHVPRPFRALKRLVGAALLAVAASAPAGGRTVLFFAEEEGLAEAAEAVGFARRATWRVIAMHG